MTEPTIEEQVRAEARAQLEEALDSLDPAVLKADSAEHFRAIANAETDEERELAIVEAVEAGESEAVIRAASRQNVDAGEDEDEDEDEDEGLAFQDFADVEIEGPVTVTMNLVLRDPGTLSNAIDSFNASLGRFGTDPFYVIARDDHGNQWVINSGRLLSNDDE